ncbi:hypothetical protein CAPTEDRAFT_193913 [Capitella teleta]|uniref:Protein CMSS1 n=1 Tax=Capitella teleta TaxID=283909 RepID=R7UYZ5_CAPTE|nr:hypothetical protein CAPTEDRAFT_193913 [Capitella teleta]|eukprot:ELU11502.1 hypothetical protein CAPTEDRAFT_193913 [Capitella teleta]
MADDLDDDWWQNDSENNKPEEDDADDAIESEPEVEAEKSENGKKRKIESTKEEDEEAPKKKKKKKRKKISDELAKTVVQPLQAQDFIEEMNKFFTGKLSGIEQEEILLDDQEHFGLCNQSPENTNPCPFFLDLVPKWKKFLKNSSSTEFGSPLLLVVSASGIRCANLNRDTKLFKTDAAKTAKLFAKHMKLKDQMKYLQTKPVHMGFGTPNRIHALLDSGALKMNSVKFIVFDWSNRDSKLRRMIDIPEVKKDLCALLKKYFVPHSNEKVVAPNLLYYEL